MDDVTYNGLGPPELFCQPYFASSQLNNDNVARDGILLVVSKLLFHGL